ncbi:MAG: nucleotidyltransferase domain-containing protein [Zestosphaera sp.]
MISSEPSEDRSFLDHDLVVDRDERIYLVVGNTHPNGLVVAYLKYVPSKKPTMWGKGGTYYERVLREYSVEEVLRVSSEVGAQFYDPTLGVSIPVVKTSEVKEWLKPEEKLERLRRRADDLIELVSVEVSDIISDLTGLSAGSIGVTGSVLAGIHGPHSDVDLVIYGCREALEFVQASLEIGKLPEEKIAAKVLENSRVLGIEPEMYVRIIPPYKFTCFKGVPITFAFVEKRNYRYGELVLRPLKPVSLVVEVIGGDCRSLFYPSRTRVDRVLEGPRVREVISYEAEYNYLLYRGGLLKISGMLEESTPDSEYYVVVGGRENKGYVVSYGV